ncbi:MAG: hypothetical protein WAL30_04240 [Candidatus Aquirickettsiella sp.]
MSLLAILRKILINKNTSDYIKKQDVISSKRISEINFWDIYDEANQHCNKIAQQAKLMNKAEKLLQLSEEINSNENCEFIIFSERSEKNSKKIKSYGLLCKFFTFNKQNCGNGSKNCNDEFNFYSDNRL